MGNVAQDIRYALRQLHKRLGFTSVAVITLALGIGASSAIFSVVYGVLLRPLPYSDPNRIMAVFEVNTQGTWSRLADPNFDDFRDQNHSFQAIAKYSAGIASVFGAGQPTRSMFANVSADFLNVFRVQPAIGRDFVPTDMKKGAAPVAIVSYGYWRQNLGSRTDLSQLHLKIDNVLYSVIGVLPDAFEFPSETALWVPADSDGENPSRTSHNYSAVARLRDGVASQQANAEISAIARRIHDSSSEQNDYLLKDAAVVPLQESITGKARARTGWLTEQPTNRTWNRRCADRNHAHSRRRSGFARAEPVEGARSRSRLPRRQGDHDGRVAALGTGSKGEGRSGDFLCESNRSAEADSWRAEGRRNYRCSHGRWASEWWLSLDDAG